MRSGDRQEPGRLCHGVRQFRVTDLFVHGRIVHPEAPFPGEWRGPVQPELNRAGPGLPAARAVAEPGSMTAKNQGRRKRPERWIGIKVGWEGGGGDPFDHLVSLDACRLATHALILGATGSGKTNLILQIIAGAIRSGESVAVLDLRGDLVAAVIEILAAHGTDPRLVRLLDLRERRWPTGFDPLRGAGEAYFAALSVLDALEAEHDSWGVQLAETARYALMLLAETGKPLTGMERLFYDEGFLRRCLAECRSQPVLAFWKRYGAMSPDKRQAMATPVLNKVSMLFSTEGLRRTFGHPRPMDLGRHLDTPGSVLLVSLAADQLHSAGRMAGRIILSAICREIFSRVGIAESRRNRVLLVADEFQNLVGREFESILAEGRRFGLSLLAAHQTLSQMGHGMRSLLLGNVGVKVAFRLGREDSATMSKDLTGDPKGLDLASLPVGECVLWRRGSPPINVEVNQPIVRGGGKPSRRAAALLRAMRSHSAAEFEDPVFAPIQSGKGPPESGPKPGKPQAERRSKPKTNLEDWLS